jgi:hypothetical protein
MGLLVMPLKTQYVTLTGNTAVGRKFGLNPSSAQGVAIMLVASHAAYDVSANSPAPIIVDRNLMLPSALQSDSAKVNPRARQRWPGRVSTIVF